MRGLCLKGPPSGAGVRCLYGWLRAGRAEDVGDEGGSIGLATVVEKFGGWGLRARERPGLGGEVEFLEDHIHPPGWGHVAGVVSFDRLRELLFAITRRAGVDQAADGAPDVRQEPPVLGQEHGAKEEYRAGFSHNG